MTGMAKIEKFKSIIRNSETTNNFKTMTDRDGNGTGEKEGKSNGLSARASAFSIASLIAKDPRPSLRVDEEEDEVEKEEDDRGHDSLDETDVESDGGKLDKSGSPRHIFDDGIAAKRPRITLPPAPRLRSLPYNTPPVAPLRSEAHRREVAPQTQPSFHPRHGQAVTSPNDIEDQRQVLVSDHAQRPARSHLVQSHHILQRNHLQRQQQHHHHHLLPQQHSLVSLLREPVVTTSPAFERLGIGPRAVTGNEAGSASGMPQTRASPVCDSCTDGAGCWKEMTGIGCKLETKELWDRFHELGTEMIITKSGRHMFQTLRFSFAGLHPMSSYSVYIDVVPLDNKRYRYAYHRSSWLVAGKADPSLPPRLSRHPDSPFTGEQLLKQLLSLEKIKLTNNELDKSGHVILNSMHRYQPRIHIVKNVTIVDNEDDHHEDNDKRHDVAGDDMDEVMNACRWRPQHVRTFVFSETSFTAVTAYQNQLRKIAENLEEVCPALLLFQMLAMLAGGTTGI
eukprot:XP_011662774.1 PREDICTED: uncharacterized protein LOC100889015 [Strongylocentrotus purpuratus]